MQLMSLGETDTLAHTREQHSAFIVSLQQKHENEILRLNEMLDISKRAINEKVRIRCSKGKTTFVDRYIWPLDHGTFHRFRSIHSACLLSFDIYYVFNYDT